MTSPPTVIDVNFKRVRWPRGCVKDTAERQRQALHEGARASSRAQTLGIESPTTAVFADSQMTARLADVCAQCRKRTDCLARVAGGTCDAVPAFARCVDLRDGGERVKMDRDLSSVRELLHRGRAGISELTASRSSRHIRGRQAARSAG